MIYWGIFIAACLLTAVVVALVFGAIAKERDAPEHGAAPRRIDKDDEWHQHHRTPGAVTSATWSTHRGIRGD